MSMYDEFGNYIGPDLDEQDGSDVCSPPTHIIIARTPFSSFVIRLSIFVIGG
jgi:hypothetical protein